MDAGEVATLVIQSGKKFDVVLRWSAPRRWRRLGILLLVGFMLCVVYWAVLGGLSYFSRQERDETADWHKHMLEEIQFRDGMEAAEQCAIARQSGSDDAEIHCPIADFLYAEWRPGGTDERQRQVTEAKAYSAMVLDFRKRLRWHELAWQRDHRTGMHTTLLEALVSPIGVLIATGMMVLLYGSAMLRLYQLEPHSPALMSFSSPPADPEDDMVVGDMPNLPHERIHHPDRR